MNLYAKCQQARADNFTIFYCKKQIDITFLYVCPVVDHEFLHYIVKVPVGPQGNSRVDPQFSS